MIKKLIIITAFIFIFAIQFVQPTTMNRPKRNKIQKHLNSF